MNRIRFVTSDIYGFLKSFDDHLVTKIFGLLEALDQFGVYLNPTRLKKINKDIYELRITGRIAIRIFIVFKNDIVYILHAFVKKSQKLPKKDLEIAISRLKYLQ